MKNTLKQAVKSKTINFNVFAPVVLGVLSLFGVTLPVEVVVGGISLINILLRYATKTPVSEK